MHVFSIKTVIMTTNIHFLEFAAFLWLDVCRLIGFDFDFNQANTHIIFY